MSKADKKIRWGTRKRRSKAQRKAMTAAARHARRGSANVSNETPPPEELKTEEELIEWYQERANMHEKECIALAKEIEEEKKRCKEMNERLEWLTRETEKRREMEKEMERLDKTRKRIEEESERLLRECEDFEAAVQVFEDKFGDLLDSDTNE